MKKTNKINSIIKTRRGIGAFPFSLSGSLNFVVYIKSYILVKNNERFSEMRVFSMNGL